MNIPNTLAGAKKPETEQDFFDIFAELLRASLPSDWSLEIEKSPQLAESVRPDLVATISAPDGTATQLLLETKRNLGSNQAKTVSNQLDEYLFAVRSQGANACGALMAPYIPPGTRRWLAERGTSFIDATGNARIACSQPALFIERQGADKNPWPSTKSLQSLKGPSTGAAVRALVDFVPPYGVRELAERSGVSPATLSRVIDLLEQEDAIERGPGGSVRGVDWEAILRRWALDYSLFGSNKPKSFLDPRGVDWTISNLNNDGTTYALTGSAAVPEFLRVAPIRLATIFVRDMSRIAAELGLRQVDAGANVVLLEPYDQVVFERTQEDRIPACVAVSQTAIDLLTGPGRGPSEGEELVQWMRGNEGTWRVPA